jgi:hypothetical protein
MSDEKRERSTDKGLMPLQRLSQMALDAQSASNMLAVANFLKTVTSRLWREAVLDKRGSSWVNKHPLTVVLANRIAHLAGLEVDSFDDINRALAWCHDHAEDDSESPRTPTDLMFMAGFPSRIRSWDYPTETETKNRKQT